MIHQLPVTADAARVLRVANLIRTVVRWFCIGVVASTTVLILSHIL